MDDDSFHREPVFPDRPGGREGDHDLLPMPLERHRLSVFTLFLLLIFWPIFSIAFSGDPAEVLEELSVSPIFMVYLPTMAMQWALFLLIVVTARREGGGMRSLGFRSIRLIDFFWAIAFLLASNLILSLLALLLSRFGLIIPGEIALILPKTGLEKFLWVMLSLTAAICEETAFRGYLITRLRVFGRSGNWILPVVIASMAFGTGHLYQGLGGFILLSFYGAMFALLYLKTKTLWPAVIAHFFQDFSALFYPHQN